MDLQLSDRTALVTGASMGIGNAIARSLAAEGVKLSITARRGELLHELASDIVAAGGHPPHVAAMDIMDEGAPEQLAKVAVQALGHVDILVNCAGAGGERAPPDAPEQLWEENMTLNFVRVRQLTYAILPGMISRKWGRVVNISGKSEPAHVVVGHAAKAALHVWSKGLSREVGLHGITVNCISPGHIVSEQILRKYSEQYRLERIEQIPVGRWGGPEELACVAVFLSSPIAGYVSGAVVPVDGGLRRYAY